MAANRINRFSDFVIVTADGRFVQATEIDGEYAAVLHDRLENATRWADIDDAIDYINSMPHLAEELDAIVAEVR